MKGYSNIIVAADLVGSDDEFLEAKVRAVTDVDAKIHLVHFVQPVYYTGFEAPYSPYIVEQLKAEEKRSLEQIKKLAARLGVPKEHCQVLFGFPVEGVISLAEKWKVDLIIVGHHHKKWFQSLIMGHTSERVLHEAPCDILAVQIPEKKKR
jgi:universal stress protein A